MTEKLVVVGAGHAVGQLIASLRQHNYSGDVCVFGDETHLPYQRPPLSKKYLSGDVPSERLLVKPATFYDDDSLAIHLGTRVTTIDRGARTVQTDSGETVAWDKLVLATGSRVRKLPIEGAELGNVHYLRTIEDVDNIRQAAVDARKVAIIGAGYIGLEVAAVLRQQGLDVTVIEMAERVMSRVVSAEISDFYQIEHTSHGVRLRLSTGVRALQGTENVAAVELDSGDAIPADLVIVGVGILPNTELAAAAELEIDDGIVVDTQCVTSDERIFAIGDCTRHPNPVYNRNIRLESVQNALEQAKTAAANVCGEAVEYGELPWFWSDQYDLKLQIAGLSEGYDQVVLRGNPADRSFSCLYLRDGVLIAIDAVNAARDFVQAKALIINGAVINPDKLADTGRPLKDLAD